jgi:hypothetical protein
MLPRTNYGIFNITFSGQKFEIPKIIRLRL